MPSKHSHAAGSLDSALARQAAAARPSLSQPEMTRALQRAASRTLEQSTPQDPEQQAPALLRAMREVLDAPNAVGAEEEEEPTSPSSLPMQQFSLDVDQPLVSPNGQALIDAMYEALHGVEGGGAATEAGVKRASPEAHSAGMTHGGEKGVVRRAADSVVAVEGRPGQG